MVNLYAFTYPGAIDKYNGFTLIKFGDSINDVDVRMDQQGTSAEYEGKVKVGEWNDVNHISRDYQIHAIMKKLGWYYKKDGKGTEWFKIPTNSITADDQVIEVYHILDKIVTDEEGGKVRNKFIPRTLQSAMLDKAMHIILAGGTDVSIIANLCPRFGKTTWSLSLFNKISKSYGNRVMLLPAYWLAVHSSFLSELAEFDDFIDIVKIDTDDDDAESKAKTALENGLRIIVPISLHGKVDEWKIKHEWIANISNDDIFSFADEGDFGTHTENQIEKLDYIFSGSVNNKFIRVYASGTNVQRLAKCSNDIDGVLYSAYSQLEQTETTIIKRKFYKTQSASLKTEIEKMGGDVMPSWTKIWGKPLSNKAFLSGLITGLVGNNPLRPELNLSNITSDQIDCFMILLSANKTEMTQAAGLFERAEPEYVYVVLNGDYTSNKQAEILAETEINKAKLDGKKGVVFIANQMGSRSFSVPEIQATIIAYDNGSVDATTQKVSRSLTPTKKDRKLYDDTDKVFGHIIDISFDPNRSENIEKIMIDEAVQLMRSGQVQNFTDAIRFIMNSANVFQTNEFGYAVQVTEDEMFKIMGDNDVLLKVADIAVDIDSALKSGVFDTLVNVKVNDKPSTKKDKMNPGVKNSVKNSTTDNQTTPKTKKTMEKIINEAIRSLNMSATSVYFLSNRGNSYRECLETINDHSSMDSEFIEFFGVPSSDAIMLLDNRVLNEAILDVIVQNSKPKMVDNLFI